MKGGSKFKGIVLGTGKLSPGDAFGKLGYQRKGSEGVVGPMPHFGEIIKTMTTSGRSSPGYGQCIAVGEQKAVELAQPPASHAS